MLQWCYVLIQVIEILLGAWMIHDLYPEFRKESRLVQGIWIGGCLILCVLYVGGSWNSFISNISLLIFSCQFAGVYYICHRVKYLNIFLLEVLYLTSISFLKLPVLILEGVLFNKTLIVVNRGDRTVLECCWSVAILAIVMMLLIRKGRAFENYKEFIHLLLSERIRALFTVTGIQWILLSYNMWLGKRGFQTVDFVVNVLLIFCITVSLHYVLLRIAYNKIQIDKNNLDISQSQLQEQIGEIHGLYQKSVACLHEYYHTMEFLYCCINKKRYEEAKEFLHKHIGELDEEKNRVWTGLPFLDFIINYKKRVMDQKEIRFRLELDVYEYPFEEAELGVLLGNLLDNAIEACEKCEPGKREIYLRIWNARYMFMLKLANSSSKSPAMKGQKFLTDKADKNTHGMGVELVKRILKKYDGDIDFHYDKEHFEAKLFAFIMKEGKE